MLWIVCKFRENTCKLARQSRFFMEIRNNINVAAGEEAAAGVKMMHIVALAFVLLTV